MPALTSAEAKHAPNRGLRKQKTPRRTTNWHAESVLIPEGQKKHGRCEAYIAHADLFTQNLTQPLRYFEQSNRDKNPRPCAVQ